MIQAVQPRRLVFKLLASSRSTRCVRALACLTFLCAHALPNSCRSASVLPCEAGVPGRDQSEPWTPRLATASVGLEGPKPFVEAEAIDPHEC
jgi:hypothetical protein